MLSSPGAQSQLHTVTKAHHDAKIKHRGITTKFSKKEAQRPDNTLAIALKEKPNQHKKSSPGRLCSEFISPLLTTISSRICSHQ